jgi:CcmD family protein
MSQAEAASVQAGSSGSGGGAPDDRATAFQAVKGEPEHYSGETLLVTAYAVLWVIVLAWVAMAWKKQAGLSRRLDDLERVIGEAARKQKTGA